MAASDSIVQAVKDLLAMIKHDNAIDDAHQHAHDMFDPDDGNAHAAAQAFEQICRALHFRCIEPAKTFVREQEFWLAGERAGEFELLERCRAKPARRRAWVAGQTDEIKHLLGLPPGLSARYDPAAVIGRERHVLD
jgi:hypothetical protein